MDNENRLNDAELMEVNGGAGGSGYYMTVGDCGGGSLALRPQPVWDQYHEIAHLYPGYQVFTYGQTTRGTGKQGEPCSYTYVCWNGTWDLGLGQLGIPQMIFRFRTRIGDPVGDSY